MTFKQFLKINYLSCFANLTCHERKKIQRKALIAKSMNNYSAIVVATKLGISNLKLEI